MRTAIEALFEAMMSDGWANESDGDVEAPTGFFARISNSRAELGEVLEAFSSTTDVYGSPDEAAIVGHFLVVQDSQGFIHIERFISERALIQAYRALVVRFSDWNDAADEDTTDYSTQLEGIRNDELREYAALLKSAGFTLYLPGRTWDYFLYSREVDGNTYYGSIQHEGPGFHFGGFTHSMPIRPSREHGSSMFVPDADAVEALQVEAARLTARPANTNPVVGTHQNYRDAKGLERFTRV